MNTMTLTGTLLSKTNVRAAGTAFVFEFEVSVPDGPNRTDTCLVSYFGNDAQEVRDALDQGDQVIVTGKVRRFIAKSVTGGAGTPVQALNAIAVGLAAGTVSQKIGRQVTQALRQALTPEAS